MGNEADGFVYDQIKIGDEAVHSLRAGRQNFIQDGWLLVEEIFPGHVRMVESVYRENLQEPQDFHSYQCFHISQCTTKNFPTLTR